MTRLSPLLLAVAVCLSACQASPPEAASTSKPPETAAPQPTASAPAAPAASPTPQPEQFSGRVWRVQSSSAGEPGSTYAFLVDGTLVIDSPHGTPMYGQWRFDHGALTLIEEGRPYPTDILELSADTFRLRSHNPGEPVDLHLVAAPDVALPPAHP